MMTKDAKKKMIATNVVIWAVSILVSFILPMVVESMIDGRGTFLKAMVHVGPLIVAMGFSTSLISKAIGEPTEDTAA